ncbi:tol-pal system-associated acyl-CoA thioesterase [Legionella genomosp. 1]|uniref:tol-pal system-associated acyl-CoA thioesterase n=1 Tax=Legionella genomosp. 1 TaxID=1093625 RepID=UPI0013EFACCD|nr:tol-pal system-associated acyl-CoA thioesterase [Legionella genomosp. 1]
MSQFTHSSQFRVYAEDTDFMGIVYYANYLKFCERARTEMLRSNGLVLTELAKQDCHFVITDVELKYKQPARLDDLITITCNIKNKTACSIVFEQIIKNEHNSELCSALVTIVCVNSHTKPRRLPDRFNLLQK